jgi:NAD(P)-dependent dehydrogenase (short-subunit alcohol dehydrogenase family)
LTPRNRCKPRPGCEIFQCDVSSEADRAGLIAFTREKFGRLDLLVNNAGIGQRVRADILEASRESFDELIHTNLAGPHFLTQLAARWMLEMKPRPARIVFVTSISAYTASINRAEYCISKAGARHERVALCTAPSPGRDTGVRDQARHHPDRHDRRRRKAV